MIGRRFWCSCECDRLRAPHNQGLVWLTRELTVYVVSSKYSLLALPYQSYWFVDRLLSAVINEHAPVKCKTITHSHVPYMNGELRRNINYKHMLKRKYCKNRTKVNWENYKKQRNTGNKNAQTKHV